MHSTRFLFAAAALMLLALLGPTHTAQAQTYGWTSARSVSGTEASGIDTRHWAPGLSTGYFTFSYSFYSIPDSVVITFGGQPVYSSGGYVSGSAVISLSFGPSAPGTTPLLTVVMNPQGPRPGTAWDYTLTPTAKPVVDFLTIVGNTALAENASAVYSATATYNNGSTRTVEATWTSSTPQLVITSGGTYVQALATGVTKPMVGKLTAKYTEDGKTVTDTHDVALGDQTLTNNPTSEKAQDPNKGQESKIGGPVHTGTGAESFYKPLITIHGLREFEFGLNYSSTFSGVSSAVGKGWSHPFAASLLETTNAVTITWSPTQANTFAFIKANAGFFYLCLDDDARHDVLAKTADGGFTLTKQDQTRYTFAPGGVLTEIANGRGQRVNVSISGGLVSSITEPVAGVSLTFTHTSGQLTRVADNNGRLVDLTYDANGLLTSVKDVNGNTSTYGYNAAGKLATITAQDGTVICQNSYDVKGRVTSQTDGVPGHPAMTFSYNETAKGVVTTVLDHSGGKHVYTHDNKMRLISHTDPLGLTTTSSYDNMGNLVAVKDPAGRITTTSYDARGNAVRVISPGGGEMVMTYDARNNTTSVTNAAGETSTTSYDAANNPLETTDFSGAVTTRTFNANSLMTSETSPRGHTRTYSYTAGRLTSVTDALGEVQAYVYDGVGRLTSTTDPEGKTTSFTYNASGKVLEQTQPLGGKIIHTYDLRDRLVSTTDETGGVTTRTYDGNSNELTTTNPMSGVASREYDGCNRLTKETDPLGRITRRTYDAAGRLLSVTDPLSLVTSFKYDAVGNQTSVTNPAGETQATTFSVCDQPATIKDSLGRTVTLVQDVLGRLVTSSDGLKRVTETVYDGMGRVTQMINPLGQKTNSAYDASGNLTSVANPAGAATTFSYDQENKRLSSTTPGARTSQWAYDGRGLITQSTEPSGQTTNNVYDNNGRLSSRADTAGTTTYGYDAKGRLLTVTEGARTITRVYDALDRLTQFTDGDGNTLLYGYDAVGNLTSLTYPDGKVVQYAYDAKNRLTSVTDWASRVTTYAYDKAGRVIQTNRPNGTREKRTYDKAGQLTGITDTTSNGTVLTTFACTFDAGGQITSQTRKPAEPSVAPGLTEMTFDADDRLTSYNGNAVTHDLDGNMTSGPLGAGTEAFAYNSRNQLTSAGGLIYRYDAEGRRVESEAAGAITRYVNNPNAALWQVLTYRTDAGPTTYCVYGIGLLYTETSGVPLYHHYDHLGSTVVTTNSTAAVTFSTAYEPYGSRADQTGAPATPFLFVGQLGVMTEASGLMFCRARFYHPQIRRFISADPLGLDGGPNLYAYASSNPVSNTDPLGLWSWNQTLGVVKAIGGAAEAFAGGALATATGVSGVGLVAGVAVAAHGVDTFWAGIQQARTGNQVDTLTSQGLQAAGVSRNTANIADATIGIVGSFGASAASNAIRTGAGLTHLTGDTAATAINGSGVLRGSNYVGPASNATATGLGTTLRTGLAPGQYTAVAIPNAATGAFSRVWGIGPFTTWQSAMGHMYTARGALTLATGEFVRQGTNWGQVWFYFMDGVFTGARFLTLNTEEGK